MNKTYFKYLLKSRKSLCVVIAVLYVLGLTTAFVATSRESERYLLNLVIASVLLAFLTFILVPLEFKFVHNKKAVDTYFALPITRKETLVTTIAFICFIDLVPFVTTSIVSFIMGIIAKSISSYMAFAVYVIVAIISVIIFVSFITSLFLEANSTFDGIVMIFAYLLMPAFIALLIDTFQNEFVAGINPLDVEQIISYISLPTAVLGYELNLGECFVHFDCNNSIFSSELLSFAVCAVIHIIFSFVCLKRNFIERKVERAESISNRFLSYPFVIYAYATILTFSISASFKSYDSLSGMIIIYTIVFVCFLISTFVYRRKVKIIIKDVIFFIVIIVITLGISRLAIYTKGLNLAYKYDHNPKNIAYIYYDYSTINVDDHDPEILNQINKKYTDVSEYAISYEKVITEKEMSDNKNVIDKFEDLRLEAIDNFYAENRNEKNAYLYIKTNFKEPISINRYFYGLITDNKNEVSYGTVSPLTYKELLEINKTSDVCLDIVYDDYQSEHISLNELLD